jgi:hypothetical protein
MLCQLGMLLTVAGVGGGCFLVWVGYQQGGHDTDALQVVPQELCPRCLPCKLHSRVAYNAYSAHRAVTRCAFPALHHAMCHASSVQHTAPNQHARCLLPAG